MSAFVRSRWLLCVLVLACGDDKPTAPDADLVGNWRLTGMEFPQTSADRFSQNLRVLGFPEEAATTVVDEMKASADESARNTGFSVIRINADGTWEDNDGEKGTYTVDGDRLTISTPGDSPLTGRYFVTSTTLTLNVSLLDFANQLSDLGTPEEQRQFNIMLEGVDIRMLFGRV